MIVKNFLFHRVSDEKDALWPPMTPALFEKIIRLLKANYNVVCLEDWLKQGAPNAGKKVATVLFDDGYKDNIEYAVPILKKHNCPASFYVVTDCIDKNIPTWTYILDHALQQTKILSLSLSHPRLPDGLKEVSITDKSMIWKIKPWMKTLPDADRTGVLQAILNQCNVTLPQNKMMNWNDITQLINEGFHVGSHSHTHPMLAALHDESDIRNELNCSYKIIQEKTGKAPVTISYPIGSFDERVIRIAKETGYRYGLAVEQKFFRNDKDNMMAIPRVELYQEPWWKVSLRMNGIYQKVKRLW